MNELIQFVPQELVILLICTPIMGELFKQNKYTKEIVPIALFIFDVTFSILLLNNFTATTMLHGVIIWGVVIASYDSVKTLKKRNGDRL